MPGRIVIHFLVGFAVIFGLWLTDIVAVQQLIAVLALLAESWSVLILAVLLLLVPFALERFVEHRRLPGIRQGCLALLAEAAGALLGARMAIAAFPAEWW